MKKLYVLFISFCITPVFASLPFHAQEWETTNGTRVVFHQAPDVPMLDISLAFAAGSAYDGQKFGTSALVTHLIDAGHGGLAEGVIEDQFEEIGAQHNALVSQDLLILTLRTLTCPEVLDQATNLFANLLKYPDFSPTGIMREKNQLLITIKQNQESPDTIAQQTFYKALYGTHPYGHPISGNTETLNNIIPGDLEQFYHRFLVGKNAIIVLVGAIDESTAHKIAERITQVFPKGKSARVIKPAKSLTQELNIEVSYPSSQTVIRIGQLGITHHHPDYFPLLVGNYILGGGTLVSKLGYELREKQGLTYGVTSQFAAMPGMGPFIMGLSTKNSQAKTALNVTRQTLESFIKSGPTEQELTAAKQYLTGSFPLSLSSNSDIAIMLLKMKAYHLPPDFLDSYIDHINAVTTQDIKRAFDHQIQPNKLLQVSVGVA